MEAVTAMAKNESEADQFDIWRDELEPPPRWYEWAVLFLAFGILEIGIRASRVAERVLEFGEKRRRQSHRGLQIGGKADVHDREQQAR
jgi:hypothetical protein